MYLAAFFFLIGLCLMGWSISVWSIALIIVFIVSIPYYHWTVLLEEAFWKISMVMPTVNI